MHVTFPSGLKGRHILAYKFIDTLVMIGQRIGSEMARKHLTGVIRRFFKNFSYLSSLPPACNVPSTFDGDTG